MEAASKRRRRSVGRQGQISLLVHTPPGDPRPGRITGDLFEGTTAASNEAVGVTQVKWGPLPPRPASISGPRAVRHASAALASELERPGSTSTRRNRSCSPRLALLLNAPPPPPHLRCEVRDAHPIPSHPGHPLSAPRCTKGRSERSKRRWGHNLYGARATDFRRARKQRTRNSLATAARSFHLVDAARCKSPVPGVAHLCPSTLLNPNAGPPCARFQIYSSTVPGLLRATKIRLRPTSSYKNFVDSCWSLGHHQESFADTLPLCLNRADFRGTRDRLNSRSTRVSTTAPPARSCWRC